MIKQFATRKIAGLRRLGLRRAARISIDRFFLSLLRRVFKFHPWHVEAPLSARPYRRLVATIVNRLEPKVVVEAGCGLGAILHLVKAPYRRGYDIDKGAVRAARFLRGRKIVFTSGSLEDVAEDQIDVLILVNWIHELSPENLAALLAPLLSRVRYLLLDAIDPAGPEGYKFKHDFAFLDGKASLISVDRPAGEGRSFRLYEVLS
jgi:SAM-dependent methyltransferase